MQPDSISASDGHFRTDGRCRDCARPPARNGTWSQVATIGRASSPTAAGICARRDDRVAQRSWEMIAGRSHRRHAPPADERAQRRRGRISRRPAGRTGHPDNAGWSRMYALPDRPGGNISLRRPRPVRRRRRVPSWRDRPESIGTDPRRTTCRAAMSPAMTGVSVKPTGSRLLPREHRLRWQTARRRGRPCAAGSMACRAWRRSARGCRGDLGRIRRAARGRRQPPVWLMWRATWPWTVWRL